MDRRVLLKRGLATAVGVTAFAGAPRRGAAAMFEVATELYRLRVRSLVEGLDQPWGMAFLPTGEILVTEQPGRLRLVREGQLVESPLGGVPRVLYEGQGGLLDVAVQPNFATSKFIHLTYAEGSSGQNHTVLARGRLGSGGLSDVRVLFRSQPAGRVTQHYGSRIVYDGGGHVFLSVGDRKDESRVQSLDAHNGKIIRLLNDGRVPSDNPFVGRQGARPEIWALGVRNPQGLARQPDTQNLFECEHGPQGGDEINVIERGKNYGWPTISWGCQYGQNPATCQPIGGGERDGLEQPLNYWTPSIAPGGMGFYEGDRFPGWRGDLFVAALKYKLLVRLRVRREGTRLTVTEEERLLENRIGRIRQVKAGPDGRLYLLTDEGNGAIWTVERA